MSKATPSLDAPETTAARRAVIFSKPLLKSYYDQFYAFAASQYTGGRWVELGSGAGFIKQVLPNVQTSDYLDLPDQDLQIDALNMPFNDGALAGIYMLDVLHHIQDCGRFFEEADRCLSPGGRIVMQEPWNSAFGRFIYQHFHHEPFLPDAAAWTLPPGGPLSMANGALPWILFVRDRALFERRFPRLKIRQITGVHPVLYLLSGGFTARQLAPSFALPFVRWFDRQLARAPFMPMFVRIVVEKAA